MNLYEFTFKKVFEDGLGFQQRVYQVPAENLLDAAARLGQVYHREDYTIEIVSYKEFLK